MKKSLLLCTIILSSISLQAQAGFTNVSGQAIDSTGQIYSNGTWQANFVQTPGINGPFLVNGQPFTQTFSGKLDASGNFSVTVADNTIVRPGGSQWAFVVCPNATFQCSTYTATVAGVTLNVTPGLTQFMKPMTGAIKPTQINSAYQDNQIAQAVDGSFYFNTTNSVYRGWYNNIWNNITGTSGGPGGTGWGSVVPTQFPTVQAAVNAGGPVIVLPSSTDNTSYTNPSNVRIQNYKQNSKGADSLFFRDVSEWGPVDGATVDYCNGTAGSNVLNCGVSAGYRPFTPGPVSAGGDVGKLIVISQLGPATYGSISTCNGNCPMSVASTTGVTTPGPPNSYQTVTFTDTINGCTTIQTMPYAHVHLDATGMPTGNLDFNNWAGKACTAVPTRGTVSGVTGTVTFTGGSIAKGDLVTTITGVNNGAQITVADNVTFTGQGVGYFGSDVHDTFQAACNAVGTGTVTNGTLTFSGIGLTSHGIDCNSAGLHILGRSPIGAASLLVYAGKTHNNLMNSNFTQRVTGGPNINSPVVPNTYILSVADGGGARIERMHFHGNSQAMPYGLMISFGAGCQNNNTTPASDCFASPGGGNFISQMGFIDQVNFGTFWGDPMKDGTMRLQSGLFNAAFGGNGDFWTADHINCYGADACVDGVFDQATNWHFGTVQIESNNIGFVGFGAFTEVKDLYSEVNRVDFMQGSTYWAAAGSVFLHIISYGGESSAMEIEASQALGWANSYYLQVDQGSLGGAQSTYGRPDGVSMEFTANNNGGVGWSGGGPRGKVILPYTQCGASGSYGGLNYKFNNLTPQQIQWSSTPGSYSSCSGWGGGGWLDIADSRGPYNTHTRIPLNLGDWVPTVQIPLMLEVNRSQVHIGSLNVQPPSWGYGIDIGYGTYNTTMCSINNGYGYPGFSDPPTNSKPTLPCGSTTYNYQITCTDSLNNETTPSIVYNTNGIQTIYGSIGAPATLSNTNYTLMHVTPREGCPQYNLYGDNGIGGCIGFLTSQTIEQMGNNGSEIYDTGTWTKNCSKVPPTTTNSGSVSVAGNLTINGLTTLNNVIINGTCNGSGCGTGGPGGPTSISALTPATRLNAIQNGNFMQDWSWALNNATNFSGLYLHESAPSSFATPNPTVLSISTLPGSTTYPLNVEAGEAANGTGFAGGVYVTQSGQVITYDSTGTNGSGLLISKIRIPSITSAGSLGTDASGNIILGTGGPGSGNSVTSPFTVNNGTNQFIITVPATGNPTMSSTSGVINISQLFAQNLAGVGTRCLQADPSGNVIPGTAGCGVVTATPWSALTPGVLTNTGTSQYFVGANTQVRTTTGGMIVANYITPSASPTGAYVIPPLIASTCLGANSTANGLLWTPCSSGTGGIALSSIAPATVSSTIQNSNFAQNWQWTFPSTGVNYGLLLNESAVSTNPSATIFEADTLSGSTATPFRTTAGGTNGLAIDPATGNILASGSAKFVGPVQVTGITNPAASLGTDALGNVIVGSTSTGLPATATLGSILGVNPANTWIACPPPATSGTLMGWSPSGCPITGSGIVVAGSKFVATLSTNTLTYQGGIDVATTGLTVGGAILRGGDAISTTTSTSTAGSVLIRGGNNSSPVNASGAGHVGLYGGASTGTGTPGHQGFRQTGQYYTKNGTVTQWNLQQLTGAESTSDATSTNLNTIGVAQNVGATAVLVVDSGEVPVNATAAVTVGHTVCASGPTVTDSGGSGDCGTGTYLFGVVTRTTGTYSLPDGTSAPLSTTLPAVKILALRGGGASGAPYPTSVGIANFNGTAWTTGFNNTTNPIPANYIANPLTQNTSGTASNITAGSNSTLVTLSSLALPYAQLTGTVPTWNQSTTGNAATATRLSTNGTANQRWGMDATGTTQGWQTPSTTATALSTNGTANQRWGMDSTGTTQGWQTPSPNYSAPIYSTIATGITGSTTVNTPIYTATMVTAPTGDRSYRFASQIALTTAGTSCSAGVIAIRLGYTDPDSGAVISTQNLAVYNPGTPQTLAANFNVASASVGVAGLWYTLSRDFRAQAGSTVTITVYQSTAMAGCGVLPVLTFRPALYDAGY